MVPYTDTTLIIADPLLCSEMGNYTAEDPVLVEELSVDGDGRIYVGRKYSDRDFKVILEGVDDDE